MPEDRSCPKCGARLAGDALAGLCPGCVLEGALQLGAVQQPGDAGQLETRNAKRETPHPRFGDYELLEEIARGGMGVVFRARQVSLDRIVAVKLILYGQLADDAAVKRFRAEATAAARLRHSNIVAIHEVGEQAGQHFFSMDYVEGRNLADFAREHPVSAREAARLLKTVAEAVHYAHENGIVHRDLKPANILIDGALEPRLTDFGLAKDLKGDSDLTLTGQVLGSPNYIAPEQCGFRSSRRREALFNSERGTQNAERGQSRLTSAATRGQVGPYTDIYSLGAILYHLLAGRPPFAAETVPETLRQAAQEEPVSPRALNPSVPRDLETICLKCLEKEPARRFTTAAELADDLNRFLHDEPITARPISRAERGWRWCRRKPVVASLSASVMLLLALGFAGISWQLHRARQRTEQDRQRLVRLNVATGVRLMDQGDWINALPWLAQALQLDAGHPKQEAIHRLRLGTLLNWCPTVQVVVSHEAQITYAEFSPDGQRMVTASRDRTARVWDAFTGKPITKPLQHHGVVRWAAFSPDGRRVATASGDKTAVLWDVASGQPTLPPLVHSMDVRRVAFSPDGRRLLTLSGTSRGASEVRVWDVATGQPVTAPMSHALEVQHAVFSPDGRRIATACGHTDSAGEVWLWDAASGQVVAGPAKHRSGVFRLAFSPDGEHLLAAGGNVSVLGEVRIWDALLRESRKPAFIPAGQATCAAFSPDGARVLTGGYDKQVQIWNPNTGDALTSPLKHDGLVFDAGFSPDGRWIVTASADLTARIWDAKTGDPVGPPLPHLSGLDWARFSPDSRSVLTAGLEPVARIWQLPARERISQVLRHDHNLRHASFSPDSTRVATATGLGQCRIWETATGRMLTDLRYHTGLVWRAVFSPDGSRLVTSSREQSAVIWDTKSGQLLAQLPHSNGVPDIAFSRDGKRVATASWDKTARLWDAKTGQPITPPLLHQAEVEFPEFSPDGQYLLTTSQGALSTREQIGIWETATGERVPHSLQHRDRVILSSFSPDGRRIVTASRDQSARVWEFASWKPLTPPLKHNGPVLRAFFSPDGRWVVTASIDATARVWDAATGQPVTPPLKHKMDLFHVTFSRDSRFVATASWDGTARVWDAATGDAVTPSLRHDNVSRNTVEHVAFSPDGRWVVTASWDKTARLWPLSGTDRPVDDLMGIAQVQSGHKISVDGELSPLPPEGLRTAWQKLRSQHAGHFEASRNALR